MKNNAHSARQLVFCCVTTLLTALLAVLTFLNPERLPLSPLLVRMLLLPALLLVTAGVNFGGLKTGVRTLFAGKPDRHTAAALTVLLALVLCALGVYPDALITASLLLTASAWLDLLEQRLEAEIPSAPSTQTAETIWAWAGIAAAVCAAAVWAVLHASADAVLARALCVLAASALCPFRPIALLTERRAMRRMSVPAASAQTVEALGTADAAFISPEGLLTGAPAVSDLRPVGMEKGQFLMLAASVMQGFETPEARAILTAAQSRGLTLLQAEACTQTPDGFSAVLDGKRYYAGTPEQLRSRGIFAPRADDVLLSGKTPLLFGMEGGMYLGLIALQSPLLPGALEAIHALAAQRLRPALAVGSQPLYTKQLAAQTGAEAAEAAQKGRAVCIHAGDPGALLQGQTPCLSVQTLADAAEAISVCRRAVRTRRGLQGLSAVCAFLLTGAAGGLLAPALDLGASPALCALLACCLAALTILPASTGQHAETAAERAVEDQLPLPEPEPSEPAASSRTLTIRMEELPAMPGKAALEQALLDVPGVRTAEADYESGLILVTGTAEKEPLLQAIAEAANA